MKTNNDFSFITEILLLFIIVLMFSCSSPISPKEAFIHFDNQEYNFGIITYKEVTEYDFEFTNPGKAPLIITSVETSCGCTAANWTKEPVKPGKSGQVTVKYDADLPGVFYKTIKVHYNGKNSPVQLSIKGQVEYPENLEEPVE